MGFTKTALKTAAWQMGVLNAEIRFQCIKVGVKFMYHSQLLAKQAFPHHFVAKQAFLNYFVAKQALPNHFVTKQALFYHLFAEKML